MSASNLVVSGAITEEQLTQLSGAFSLDFNMIKALFGGINVKWNFPGDKPKLVAFIKAGSEWLQTVAEAPLNFDDLIISKLADILAMYFNSMKAVDNNGNLIVGSTTDIAESAHDVSMMSGFISGFSAAELPDPVRQKLMANPRALKAIKKLSREDQIKLFNSSDLLDMVIKYGPIILRIVMMFLL